MCSPKKNRISLSIAAPSKSLFFVNSSAVFTLLSSPDAGLPFSTYPDSASRSRSAQRCPWHCRRPWKSHSYSVPDRNLQSFGSWVALPFSPFYHIRLSRKRLFCSNSKKELEISAKLSWIRSTKPIPNPTKPPRQKSARASKNWHVSWKPCSCVITTTIILYRQAVVRHEPAICIRSVPCW